MKADLGVKFIFANGKEQSKVKRPSYGVTERVVRFEALL